jgi:hypothetical protein
MAWHLQLGFDEGIMQKVDPKEVKRQRYIFSILTLMLLAVAILVVFSCFVFTSIIFHQWVVAISVALFIGYVVFNMYRFLVVSALNASTTALHVFQSNHELAYADYLKNDIDFSQLTDEKILRLVNVKKDELRKSFAIDASLRVNPSGEFLSMAVRFFFIVLFAIVFASGIELFIYKGPINETLSSAKDILSSQHPDSWTLQNLLVSEKSTSLISFESSSLLMLLDIMNNGLGYWKLLMDFLVILIFLLPMILVFKSREILRGPYVREQALHEIAISHYHYLKTQKACYDISKSIKSSTKIPSA